jgi:REP element-mobilizing transposase RayT
MGYPLREELPGAYYHVGTRGNNRRDIFSDDTSRLIFLLMLQRLARRYDWRVLAYCLMVNHYHLVLRLGDGGMSRGMQYLNGGYAFTFNQREGRRDHLFGRRFWSRELEGSDDILRTCAYVELNPLRSFEVAPGDWQWNSYRATAGLTNPLGCHHPAELWAHLDPVPRVAMAVWPGFVESYAEGPGLVSDT